MYWNKYIRSNKGSALIWTIIVFVVLVILGISLLTVSLAETKFAVRQERTTQAHYVARAGAESVAAALISDRSKAPSIVAKTSIDGTLDSNNFSTVVDDVDGDLEVLRITSTGTVNDVQEVVNLVLKKAQYFEFDFAMFGEDAVGFGGSINTIIIQGDAGTGANTTSGNVTLDEGYQVHTGVDDYELGAIKVDEWDGAAEVGPFTGDDTVVITGDTMLKTSRIDLGGNDRVDFSGSGEVHLLVEDKFELKGNSSLYADNEGLILYIYYIGSGDINVSGKIQINGSIYAPDSHFNTNGGGNGFVDGSITTKSINLNGGVFTVHCNGEMQSDLIDTGYYKLHYND